MATLDPYAYGTSYLGQMRFELERERGLNERAFAGDPQARAQLLGEQVRPQGRWRLANILDNFASGVRQGTLLDNLLFEDPEVQAGGDDLPVVRMIGLLAGAVGEGALTQSWMLRGVQAVAKSARAPKVAQSATRALEEMLSSDDLIRRVAGQVALGASNEAVLNILGGRDFGEVASATGIAGVAGSLVGAGSFGLTARRALKAMPEEERALSELGFGRLREIVNERFRYEHAMRSFGDLAGIEGRSYADDFRMLKARRVATAHEEMERIREGVVKPLTSGDDKKLAFRQFLELVGASHEHAMLSVRGGSEEAIANARARLDDATKAAGRNVLDAFNAHTQILKGVAEHARTRIGSSSPANRELFDETLPAADDFGYAAMLADVDALLDSGKRFHVQFLRQGAFVERAARKDAENYFEFMHRALTRVRHDQLVEEFIDETTKVHGVQVTPLDRANALEIEANGERITLADGQRIKSFNTRPAHIYKTYAVTDAHMTAARNAEAINRKYRIDGGGEVAVPHATDYEEVDAIKRSPRVYLPEEIADRLTHELHGQDIFDKSSSGIGAYVRKATAAWKYNTIWWGLSRFFGTQVIGDAINVTRENPAVWRGGANAPAVKAMREIFRHYRTPMWSNEQAVTSAVGAAVGSATYGIASEDPSVGEALAAGLAGAGLGYAAATRRAAGSLQAILAETRAAAVTGAPVDFSVHVPKPTPAVAAKLAKTKVVDPTTNAPRIVFHGTATAFDEFDEAFLNPDDWARGFFFTENPRVATKYSNKGIDDIAFDRWEELMQDPEIQRLQSLMPDETLGTPEAEELFMSLTEQVEARMAELLGRAPNVRMVRLRIENPFDLDTAFEVNGTVVQELRRRFGAEIVDPIIQERGVTEGIDETTFATFLRGQDVYDLAVGFGGSTEAAREVLRGLGYDGITHIGGTVMGDEPHRVWIAFDKAQIYDAFDAPEKPLMEAFAGRAREAAYEAKIVAKNAAPLQSGFYEQAQAHGVIGSGYVAQERELARRILGESPAGLIAAEVSGGTRTRDTILSLIAGRVHGNPAGWAQRVLDSVDTLQQERENWLRLASYIQQVEDGASPLVAGKRASESLVDYGRFTDFEDKYLRGFLLPFYAFTRHNTANWVKAAAGRGVGGKPATALMMTGAIAGVDVAAQAWNEVFFRDTEAKLADWQRDSFHVIMGNPFTGEPYVDKNGRPMVLLTDLGYEATLEMMGLARPAHVLNAFGAGIPKERGVLERALAVQELESSPLHVREALDGVASVATRLLTPAVRVPGELLSNSSWAFDAPIVPENYRGTPEAWAFRLEHAGKEVLRQYRELDRVMREGERGSWSPITSAFGLGLPFTPVDVDANVRRRLHTLMAQAENEHKSERAKWREAIDEMIASRPRWDQPHPDEPSRLNVLIADTIDDPNERESALRYYVNRTSKSSVQRHWQSLSLAERARVAKTMAPADLSALAYYSNGGVDLNAVVEEEMAQRAS